MSEAKKGTWSHVHADDGMTWVHHAELTCDAPEQQAVAADPILRYFEYRHLPSNLQEVSQPFCALAHQLVHTLERNPERGVALRKLLESKDAAVRAAL
jgi:hypothetical protein